MWIILLLIMICVLMILLWSLYSVKFPEEPPVMAKKLPIIGHGHLFLGGSIKLFNAIKMLSTECTKSGGVTRIHLGPFTLYGVTDPEDCLTVANTCLQKADVYNFGKAFFGEGLITCHNVMTWKRHRKLLNPIFNRQVLNSFINIFNRQSRRLVDTFAANIGETFDHEVLLRSNNLETICITSTGINVDKYDLLNSYIICLNEFLEIITKRFAQFWLHSNYLYHLTTMKHKQDIIVKKLHQLTDFIVQINKREMIERNQSVAAVSNDKNHVSNVQPFLNKILELAETNNCLNDEEVREETDTIIAAGHETTSGVLTFALTLLGSYPRVQNKVFEEIIKVIGNNDRDVDKDHVSELVYIEAVLKETMRLYPLTPVLARRINTKIKLKNYTLKPSRDCILSIWSLHHHEMWGADADQFRPERWLEPETLPDMNYYYGAFGLGRRNCIGKVYAMMSMKILLVHIIRKYKVISDITNLVLKFDVLLKFETGHHIQLELR